MSEALIAHHQAKRNLALKRLKDLALCAQKALSDPTTISRFEMVCSRLDTVMEAFNEAHINLISEISQCKGDTGEKISKETSYQEEADNIYFEILETKHKLLPEVKVSPPITSSQPDKRKHTQLPPIRIPTFSGSFKDFPGYLDLFNSLVHTRTDLSDVEKFQYLQASLSGEPINIIRAYPISETNYLSAYNALVNRYDNKRFLAFMCWEQINNVKSMSSSSVVQLRNLLDTFNENLSILKGLGLPVNDWDFILFYSLLTKLDKASREAFELSSKNIGFPHYQDLKSFIEDRCNALERSNITNNANAHPSNRGQTQSQPKAGNLKSPPTMLLAQASGTKCVVCNDNHPLYLCPKFLEKSPQQRFNIVKQNKFCLNCLRSNHTINNCHSTHTCKTCHSKHNSLLHLDKSTKPISQSEQNKIAVPSAPAAEENQVIPMTSLSNMSTNGSGSSFVMLATAEVEVKDGWGSFQTVRVLLDPGSQSQIITNACVNRLGLTRYKSNTPMAGIGEMPTQSNSKVFLEIRPIGKPGPTFNTEAVTLSKICGNMPTHNISENQFDHLANIRLADENYHRSRPVDMLIGGEIFPHILLPGKIEGGDHAPTALNTVFGFVLMGKTSSIASPPIPLSINHVSVDANLDVMVQKFWELDKLPSPSSGLNISDDDARCELIYQSSHKRNADGRYTVSLPFRDQKPTFVGSYQVALRRFKQLEKRLCQNPTFHEEYSNHVKEYLSTGQMEEIPPDECQSPFAYYIPHHAVVKPDRKLRVVYDASTKDNCGVSLNDTLLTGSKLQADIGNILLYFRLHAIVFTADIRQMYRQIIITQDHQDFQRILFRSSPDQPIREYRLQRVTFGVSSAPFLALRTIQQLANDEEHSFPLAAAVLRNDLYVDDVVTGAPDIPQALEIKQQLVGIMASAGFELRKWSSNSTEMLQDILETHKAIPDVTFDTDSSFVKVLGLAWNSHQDSFTYQVNHTPRDCTKRTMLSELARVYDPIGLLTPLTFLAKHLIQRLWLLGTSWDDPVPEDIRNIWMKFTQQLPHISQLRIPRRITRDDAVSYQLHGFCDASEAGYAGVVYLRSSNSSEHQVLLVTAKSRVSPTKRRTLPRLELCGASLLADLLHFVVEHFSKIIPISSVHAWSDSMIVLAWIKSKSTNFKAFVGNRVSNIQRKLPNVIWKHVPGKQNPADCASRGLSPDELANHCLWWTGPQWLAQDHLHWPDEPVVESLSLETDDQVSCENRSKVCTVTNNGNSHSSMFDILINKFSSIRKIQRIIAYCYRFINALRNKRRSGHLVDQELHDALMLIVRHVQISEFGEEINKLNSGQLLSKTLRKLNPFVDPAGVLRVGGRLARSELEFHVKHPILLPCKHRLTQLIIQCMHNENFHPGLQTLQYLIQQQFWIMSARRAIKQTISNCYRCFRYKPVAPQPEMADLPKARITQIKAFQSVGCDYAGPFHITFQRYRGARSTKAYLCLFVCFATKALHLELASDLSTEAFLAALRRFIARRGRCNVIHSDCGTNFKGAQSHLATVMRTACETERISFKFNPAGAPHYGGLWEAGVKSVKTHLYRVLGNQTLTYEEFNTLLTQIESLLNSRPLCPLSSDPNDLAVLTPGHFLTLAPLTTVPTPDYTNVKINRLTRWQLLQRMHQDFWSRWHSEYLNTLSQRLKWTKPSREVHVGQLVLIRDESNHPLRWRFGRIVQLFYGRDGVARSATVNTTQGIISRPLVKLCPVPTGQE